MDLHEQLLVKAAMNLPFEGTGLWVVLDDHQQVKW
jgi:hypothetical protein